MKKYQKIILTLALSIIVFYLVYRITDTWGLFRYNPYIFYDTILPFIVFTLILYCAISLLSRGVHRNGFLFGILIFIFSIISFYLCHVTFYSHNIRNIRIDPDWSCVPDVEAGIVCD